MAHEMSKLSRGAANSALHAALPLFPLSTTLHAAFLPSLCLLLFLLLPCPTLANLQRVRTLPKEKPTSHNIAYT